MMELQPGEALKNNTFGTALLAELSAEFGVKEFVLISTDKAINPTNVMGASKRLAEVFLQAYAAANSGRTRFIAVRFGNVLGSSGSVIPIFKKQIAAGGPVKVTHPEITRYFMTIPEAAGLVLQAATQGTGGEIFVLDMGKPVKIVDLARQLIELSGLRPDEDIEIQFTGLRPGEKLFEELSYQGENISPTTHPKIMRFVTQPAELTTVRGFLDTLHQEINGVEPDRLKLRLKQALPEYQPYLT
jgi:FlaA1/EpsC-like NDP-sugar epimerase